jgi:hypothetical protein
MAGELTTVYVPIVRQSDRQVLENLRKAIEEVGLTVTNFTYRPVYMKESQEAPFTSPGNDLQSLLDQDSVIITHFFLETSADIALQIRRHLESADPSKQPINDILQVDPRRQAANVGEFAKILAACRNKFNPIDRNSVLAQLNDDAKRHYAMREQELDRLATMQGDFFRKFKEFSTDQAKQISEHQAALDEAHAKRMTQLEQQYTERQAKLDDERKKFVEEKQQFDLRDTTAVRRDLVKGVKDILAARASNFRLSDDAYKRRSPVLWAFIVMVGTLGGLAATFIGMDLAGYKGAESGFSSIDARVMMIVRQIIFTIAFAIALSYFIKWLNNWSAQHANEEFYGKRFQLDIVRAAFLVETVLEWAKGSAQPPPYLVERLSRNLFDSDSDDIGPTTAADALASALFGSAANAKIRIGDNELSFNRKDIRNLNNVEINGDQ